MLTRCPHCQTAFRVTPEQLKVRQGRVRCGECRAVFDALDSLADETPALATPAPEPAGATAEDAFPADRFELVEADEAVEPPAALELPEPLETREPVASATPDTFAAPEAPAVEEPAMEEPAANTVLGDDVPEEESVPATPPARRWPWIGGVSILLLLAAAQLLFVFRVELAVLAPELRPALAAGCDLLGCVLPRPRKPELIGIETSDLAPAGPEHLLLTATLKNRAPFDQEFPHLELTLTDTHDAALLRKVLPPADYLPPGQPPASGFAARGDSSISLTLAAPGIAAVGYRLYLFYP